MTLPVTERWLAARVRRYHTEPMEGQNLADHQWGVAFMIDALHPNPSINLLRAALRHDLAERWTGDTPAPVKWSNPGLAMELGRAEDRINSNYIGVVKLTDDEKKWLKSCDLLELVMFCGYQLVRGNRLARDPYSNGCFALQHRVPCPDQVSKALELIIGWVEGYREKDDQHAAA